MASSAFKICPTCQKRWASTFKFCPEDGSSLADEPSEATASASQRGKGGSRRSSRILDLPPVTASLTNPSTPAALAASKAPPEPARAARPPVKGGAAGKVPASNKTTVADVPAADATTAAPRASRTAPTLLVTPAITEELAQQALGRSRQPDPQRTRPELAAAKTPAAPPAEAPPAQPPSEGKRKRGGFSETEWFLAPINPDEVDAKTGKVKVDPSKYERNPATPEEKRRRFSLKRDDEE